MNTMPTTTEEMPMSHAARLPNRSIGDWLSALRDGFSRPIEYWPSIQRGVALALAAGCACWIGFGLCAAADVSGREARRAALAALETKLQSARTQLAALPALRQRAHQLGATNTPEPVPDNGALLKLMSLAIDRSGVVLELFEPGAPAQVAGVDETQLRVRASGGYAQLARFAGELAILGQPVIPVEMHLVRERSGALVLDASLRVIGAPRPNSQLEEGGVARKFSELADPFKSDTRAAGDMGGDFSTAGQNEFADDPVAGTFEAEGHRAALVHSDAGWQLVEVDMPPNMPLKVAQGKSPDSAARARTAR
jgi:Tfp pilus assembly protein PilO